MQVSFVAGGGDTLPRHSGNGEVEVGYPFLLCCFALISHFLILGRQICEEGAQEAVFLFRQKEDKRQDQEMRLFAATICFMSLPMYRPHFGNRKPLQNLK